MSTKAPVSRDIPHTFLSILFIGLLIAACFWVLLPFLVSLLWAAVIVIATWPLKEGLQARLANRKGLAVTIMVVMMLLIILVPVVSAVVIIARNADALTEQARVLTSEPLPEPPAWLERIPLAGETIAESWRSFVTLSPADRSAKVASRAKEALQWFAAHAGSIGATMIQLLLMVIIAIILYAKGEVVREGIFRFARRLAGQQGEDAAILAGKAVRGVVLGVVVTALIQAGIGGLGLFITGVPAAGLLAAVMLILCLAQIGPLLVLVPSVIWLYWSGQPAWGTALLVISVIAGTVDNIVRPFLIRKGADLPILLIFAGVIGGLVAFGVIGLFIGPVILAVTYTLLKAWVMGNGLEDEAASGPDQ